LGEDGGVLGCSLAPALDARTADGILQIAPDRALNSACFFVRATIEASGVTPRKARSKVAREMPRP
jgi:hypothetical protein